LNDKSKLSPLAISQFLARGPHGRGRISLTRDPDAGLQYAGEPKLGALIVCGET
jgi:D-alanyl-D-alanine carboxypeptidase/D-alanyl-D-alanine-endopeptidase (penicillin-binding protein 4)